MAAGLVLVLPPPAAVAANGHILLAIFVGLIVGLMVAPLPMGAVALIALAVALLSGTLSPETAFGAFGAPVLWLIVSALVMARALADTGLSRRLAFRCIEAFGTSPIRLAYALAFVDLVLAPFIPSDTARAGGIVFPIARSLAEANDSHPGPTAARLGRFLMQSCYQVGVTTAAMFVTSMSANPLIVDLAAQGSGVEITWLDWALASSLPGLTALSILPFLIFRLDPPTLTATPEAPQWARAQRAAMGPITLREKWQIVILVLMVLGWMTQPLHGLHAAAIAIAGVALALITGVIKWDRVLGEQGGWDALVWFGIVLMLAKALNEAGVTTALTAPLVSSFAFGSWMLGLGVLVAAYVAVHYLYASMTAQIVTLYPVFLAVAIATGAPPLVAALALAFFSNLNASITHYGSGSGPVLFEGKYVSQLRWWRTGFVVAVVQLAIWLGIGIFWWRITGFY